MNTSKDTKLAQMQSLLHDESSPLGMESAIHTDASRAASKQSMLSSKRSGSPTSKGGAMHEMKQMNSMRDSVENSIPHGHGSHGSRSKTSLLSRQSSKKSSQKDIEEGERNVTTEAGTALNDNPELFKGPFEDTELNPDVYAC